MKKRFPDLLRKIFCLPYPAVVAVVIPSGVFVVLALAYGHDGVLEYLAYLLSAYALIVAVTAVVRLARSKKPRLSELPPVRFLLQKLPFLRPLAESQPLRAQVSLYGGFIINAAYVFINLFSGIYYGSVWFISLAAYYLFLSLSRFSLLHYLHGHEPGEQMEAELKRYRFSGGMLLMLNLALSGLVTLMVLQNKGASYGGALIYVMAIYAFYCMISSVMNVVKFRKYQSPVLSAAKVLSLTAAMVSMLSLEAAMLSRFDISSDLFFRRAMTASTGFAVCAVVLGMAVFMLIHSSRRLRKERKMFHE